MLGLRPDEYAITRTARERGIGEPWENKTEWRGDFAPGTRFVNVDIPALDALSLAPRAFDRLGRALLASRPEQDLTKCVACGRCAAVCPAHAVELDGRRLRFDYARCIRCYCCHEMCPHDAIVFREGPLMKMLKALGLTRA